MDRRTMLKGSGLAAGASLFASRARALSGLSSIARTHAMLAAAKPMIAGPVQPTWQSVSDNYTVPDWFNQARFGIFIHWGLYSIPAHINEWYAKHMYTSDVQWHTEHYGPPDKFGYKDFIPLFTAKKYDPDAWASLFKEAGARYVMPVAEHHDGFAMWDSDLTQWCAGKMGPKRDLTGDLAKAVKAHGLVFGLSSHRMEHHTFMYPAPGVPNDEFDPRYADFYGPPVPGNMNDGNASQAFQEDWLARCQELVDKYEPQIVYFDNGVNPREYDGVKLRFAAYYYNRAAQWHKQVTITTKDDAYLAGSVKDFEKAQRGPKWILPTAWEVDDPIGSTWGYTDGMHYRTAESIENELVDLSSKGGNMLLNASPMGDGSIPEEQQTILRAVGKWLAVNGEAIYGSKPWAVYGEGPSVPAAIPFDWAGGSTARPAPAGMPKEPRRAFTAEDLRFTTNAGALYVFGMVWPGSELVVKSLAKKYGTVQKVTMLGGAAPLTFAQKDDGLHVQMPSQPQMPGPYALKVEGLRQLGQA